MWQPWRGRVAVQSPSLSQLLLLGQSQWLPTETCHPLQLCAPLSNQSSEARSCLAPPVGSQKLHFLPVPLQPTSAPPPAKAHDPADRITDPAVLLNTYRFLERIALEEGGCAEDPGRSFARENPKKVLVQHHPRKKPPLRLFLPPFPPCVVRCWVELVSLAKKVALNPSVEPHRVDQP